MGGREGTVEEWIFFFLMCSHSGLTWNALCSLVWPQNFDSPCLSLPSAGITGVSQHAWLLIFYSLLNNELYGLLESPPEGKRIVTRKWGLGTKLRWNAYLACSNSELRTHMRTHVYRSLWAGEGGEKGTR